MELSLERKRSIRRRLGPILSGLDSELELIEIILDSTRQYLGVVAQKEDHPVMLRLDFVRYVSMPEAELRASLAEQLRAKGILDARVR
jgi:hypothetical protein